MNALRWLGMALFILSLTACSGKDKKDDTSKTTDGPKKEATNAEKILGTWEVAKPGKEGPPPGSTVEFTKDGKYIVTFVVENKPEKMEGTYKVEGDSIKTTIKPGEKEVKETIKIKTLTDSKLVTEDEKGSVDEFKKK